MDHKLIALPMRSDERLASKIAKTIIPTLSQESILDIGCGDGIVKEQIKANINYLGLDISDSNIYEQNTKDPDIQYINGNEVQERVLKGGPWDTILLLDVLEHTRDFKGLFEISMLKATKNIIVSLPNELFILDRVRMITGKEINAHSLDLVDQQEGFKHQYIINIQKARAILCKAAAQKGFNLQAEYVRPLITKNVIARPLLYMLKSIFDQDLWSMGSVFIFQKLGE